MQVVGTPLVNAAVAFLKPFARLKNA